MAQSGWPGYKSTAHLARLLGFSLSFALVSSLRQAGSHPSRPLSFSFIWSWLRLRFCYALRGRISPTIQLLHPPRHIYISSRSHRCIYWMNCISCHRALSMIMSGDASAACGRRPDARFSTEPGHGRSGKYVFRTQTPRNWYLWLIVMERETI